MCTMKCRPPTVTQKNLCPHQWCRPVAGTQAFVHVVQVALVRQAEDRAHRKGATKAVNVYFLCAKGTCDDRRSVLPPGHECILPVRLGHM